MLKGVLNINVVACSLLILLFGVSTSMYGESDDNTGDGGTQAHKVIIPTTGQYVIGTWAWQFWSLQDFEQPEDLLTYNHVTYGMLTQLDNLSTGYLDVLKPWNNIGDVKTVQKKYPNPIYGYTIGGMGAKGTVKTKDVLESFDIGTPWRAMDIDAEEAANTKDIMSLYNSVAESAPAKPVLTSYTFEIDDSRGAGFSSIVDRVTYLEALGNPPDRYILMCYWGTQWNADGGPQDWATGGACYSMIENPWLQSLCNIPGINPKKIFLALCTAPYKTTSADKQFEYFCGLIKKYNLGGLYIWRSSGFPINQKIVDIINSELSVSPPLAKRKQ